MGLAANVTTVCRPTIRNAQALFGLIERIALILPTENGKLVSENRLHGKLITISELSLSSAYVPEPNRRPYCGVLLDGLFRAEST